MSLSFQNKVRQVNTGNTLTPQQSAGPSFASKITPVAQAQEPSKSFGGFAGNVFSSAGQVIAGTAKAVFNPIDTTKALAGVVRGGGAKAGELILENTGVGQNILEFANKNTRGQGEQLARNAEGRLTLAGSNVEDNKDLQTANALGNFYKERYGSGEKIKETMYNDPTGFALDLSALLSGGGTVVGKMDKINKASTASKTGIAANQAANATKMGTFAEGLRTTSRAIDPLRQGTRLFGKTLETATKGRKIGGSKFTNENLDATDALGIERKDLPIFATTKSPVSQTAEAVASKGIGGARILERIETVYSKMNDAMDNLVKGKLDTSVIGRNMANAVDDFKNNFYKEKNSLYKDAVFPKQKKVDTIPGYENIKNVILGAEDSMFNTWNKEFLPDGRVKYTKPTTSIFSKKEPPMLANTTATQKILNTLIDNEKQALKGFGVDKSPELKTYEGLLKGLGDKNLTTSDVYRTLQKLQEDITYGTTVKTGNNAKLALIRESLDAEFLATLQKQRPDLATALQAAEDFYKQGVKKINSSVIQAIVGNSDKPDLIVKTLLPKLTSLEDVKLLVEVLGQENMGNLRKSILDSIFTNAKGIANENLSPLGISKQIKKFGTDKLEILLNPDQFKAIKDLEQISKMMGKSAKITGGSQTSFNLLSTVGGGSVATAFTLLFMGKPAAAILSLSPLFGTVSATKIINSDLGRQFLTEGIELKGRTGQKIQNAAPVIGTAAKVSNQLNQFYESRK